MYEFVGHPAASKWGFLVYFFIDGEDIKEKQSYLVLLFLFKQGKSVASRELWCVLLDTSLFLEH